MTAPLPELDPQFFDAAQSARAWPFEEARKLVVRLEKRGGAGEIKFETGYGPSGLPHIGTFGEVARTTMVRTAFRLLTRDQVPTRLICFSDDMDGLRKVPGNVPNQEMMRANLGKPLSRVPDPFIPGESFGRANNARLRAFLDTFGFNYEFASATDYYTAGRFDEALMRMLAVYDEVMEIMLPSLGPDRRATYSPFLPISEISGEVLQVPILERDPSRGTIVYVDPADGQKHETLVTGGRVKCQWKPDWALRWFALGIDYEMSGKDLIDSVKLASRIVTALGGAPPDGFNYELFLDEHGQKISKSKGNGLTIDEWLAYASPESLGYYMFQKPRAAKRLYFDVIPRAVDDYYHEVATYRRQDVGQRLENPVFHIHAGNPPSIEMPVSFSLLLNLVSAANADDPGVLWGFITRYVPGATPANNPELDRLVGYAVRYFNDRVKPTKVFRMPTEKERAAFADLADRLGEYEGSTDAEVLQNLVFEVGKAHGFEPLRDWFKALYQVLLGADQGPRFGSFVALYGVAETRRLLADALAGNLVSRA